MEEKLINLFYGSVLHDLGKIVQRSTQQKVRHSRIGADYLQQYTDNKMILNQLRYHHYQEISSTQLEKNDLSYITYIADNIASGVDRREHEEEVSRQWNSKTNLEDVFNRFGKKNENRYFQPGELNLSLDNIFADTHNSEFSAGEYSGIVRRIEETLKVTEFTEEYMQSMLNLLEATASFIPSSTNMKEVVDISLYDHLKMTAGFAAAVFHYLEEKEETDYQTKLFLKGSKFYEEEAFLLTSFDLSGIQDFIYTITSSGAHKQLRSRSFYLDMISEWIVDSLLKETQLTRANLMYSGGGHAYLILPNTVNAKITIDTIENRFNAFFVSNFSTKLYVAFGATAFSAKEVMKGNTPEMYRNIFQRVSKHIGEKKIARYSPDVLMTLNKGGKRAGRECAVCHNVDQLLEHENKCLLCHKLEQFSKNIQRDAFFKVNDDEKGLPIGPNAYLHKSTVEDIKTQKMSGTIYAKNQFYTGTNQATRLWVADYSSTKYNDFSQYALREWTKEDGNAVKGIKRLGVLRCDVDDLGYAFMAGFSEQDAGTYNTFTRTASFSRSMSLFFKFYINAFAEDKHLTIIYAGGDDVFLLGAWDDVVVFSIELREHFLRWTNGKLTLSTGIGLFPDKTPVNIMARLTGDLEEAAKDNGKDSISLFSKEYTFTYDVFIKDIYKNKLNVIRTFFDKESERGKAFLYKLLDLIRSRDEKDRISFARLAYYLARLEESSKNKKEFAQFKHQMREWFDDSEQIRRVEMALVLYVYEIRKDE